MNLFLLFAVTVFGFGLSCLVFILRERIRARSQEMRSGPQGLRSGAAR
jgi:hypothetical protein